MSWGKHRKVQNFAIPIGKEVINIDRDGNKSVVTILYKIKFIGKDLWQVHYHILLIILQKEFIKLNGKIIIVLLNIKLSRTIP